jgi:biotin carboxylase
MPSDSKPRLLLAGGGYADIPMIRAAQRRGYFVVTSGNRPEELGHTASDAYEPADFSNREQMLAVARKHRIDAVCACCNDFSALSSAYVAEKLGLPGHDPYETALTIHHKDKFRDLCRENGIPTPAARGFEDIESAAGWAAELGGKIIVKPIDLTGGKGVSTVEAGQEPREALEKAFSISRAKRVVVEQFVEGTRHGFSAFLNRGEVVFYFSDNEHYYLNPYLVAAASAPSIVPPEVDRELCGISEKISRILELKSGIFHIQYICSANRPVIIEICRRPPGDLYVKLVEHATGVDYPGWIIEAATGRFDRGPTSTALKGNFTRHCIMASRPGTVKTVVFDPEIERRIVDRLMFWKPGMQVTDVMTTKFGIVFVQFDTKEQMFQLNDRLHELIHAEME